MNYRLSGFNGTVGSTRRPIPRGRDAVESRQEVLERTRREREARKAGRTQVQKATFIQAAWRGHACRVRAKEEARRAWALDDAGVGGRGGAEARVAATASSALGWFEEASPTLRQLLYFCSSTSADGEKLLQASKALLVALRAPGARLPATPVARLRRRRLAAALARLLVAEGAGGRALPAALLLAALVETEGSSVRGSGDPPLPATDPPAAASLAAAVAALEAAGAEGVWGGLARHALRAAAAPAAGPVADPSWSVLLGLSSRAVRAESATRGAYDASPAALPVLAAGARLGALPAPLAAPLARAAARGVARGGEGGATLRARLAGLLRSRGGRGPGVAGVEAELDQAVSDAARGVLAAVPRGSAERGTESAAPLVVALAALQEALLESAPRPAPGPAVPAADPPSDSSDEEPAEVAATCALPGPLRSLRRELAEPATMRALVAAAFPRRGGGATAEGPPKAAATPSGPSAPAAADALTALLLPLVSARSPAGPGALATLSTATPLARELWVASLRSHGPPMALGASPGPATSADPRLPALALLAAVWADDLEARGPEAVVGARPTLPRGEVYDPSRPEAGALAAVAAAGAALLWENVREDLRGPAGKPQTPRLGGGALPSPSPGARPGASGPPPPLLAGAGEPLSPPHSPGVVSFATRSLARCLRALSELNASAAFAPAEALAPPSAARERAALELAREPDGSTRSRAAWAALAAAPCLVPFDDRARAVLALLERARRDAREQALRLRGAASGGGDGGWDGSAGPLELRVARGSEFRDALGALASADAANLAARLRIHYVSAIDGLEEAGVDGGGLLREFILSAVEQLRARAGSEGGSGGGSGGGSPPGSGRAGGGPRPRRRATSSSPFAETSQRTLRVAPDADPAAAMAAGRLLGLALLNGVLVDLPLAGFLLRLARGLTPELHDLATLDEELLRNLSWLREDPARAEGLGLTFALEVERAPASAGEASDDEDGPSDGPGGPSRRAAAVVASAAREARAAARAGLSRAFGFASGGEPRAAGRGGPAVGRDEGRLPNAPLPPPSGAPERTLVPLVEGGDEREVTPENVVEYVHRVVRFRLLDEPRLPQTAFLRGLHDVVPAKVLRIFNDSELQQLIGGSQPEGGLDVADLRRHCNLASGLHDGHPAVDSLFRVLASLGPADQASFLRFVTACPRPPLLGFASLTPPFSIQLAGVRGDPAAASRLPTASTCFNLLKLPPYETDEEMRWKLLYAIRAGAGFELS